MATIHLQLACGIPAAFRRGLSAVRFRPVESSRSLLGVGQPSPLRWLGSSMVAPTVMNKLARSLTQGHVP